MKKFVAILLIASLIVSPIAAEVLVVTPAGYYLLKQDATGVPLLVKIDQVVTIGPAPTPGPGPSPVLSAQAIVVRDAALKATGDPKRTDTAGDLVILYSETAKKIRAGQIKGRDNIVAVCRMAADMVLSGKETAWKPFRDAFGGLIVDLAQTGAADEAYAALLDETAKGLEASIGNHAAADPALYKIDIARILKILEIIMQLLKLLPAAGGSLQ